MTLHLNLGPESYDILIERGSLANAGRHLKLDRRVCIVTDSGVPRVYAETLAAQCAAPITVVIEQGEGSKNLTVWQDLLARMLEAGFTRSDCVVAVGGGVVGDLAGFAAASYMRGIDFYNIPTTLLSQIDSSIGGKVAVDFHGYKNLVGAFYQPKRVLIDPTVLATLPPRRVADGMAEAIKMAACFDEELFSLIEKTPLEECLDTVILSSLAIKQRVVEQDEKEAGLRRVLNFGHTPGHAIETVEGLGGLYHGECVGLGMLMMSDPAPRARIRAAMQRVGLPTEYRGDITALVEAMRHDKKKEGERIHVVRVPAIGSFRFETLPFSEFCECMKEINNA